jgi:hypothetical protein
MSAGHAVAAAWLRLALSAVAGLRSHSASHWYPGLTTGGEAACHGLFSGSRKLNGRQALFCGDEPLPSYTERAASLAGVIWPQRKLPYAPLSATTHAELVGLQRNLGSSPREPSELRVAPGSDTAMWLWQDTYLTIGALVFTASRAAGFLGLDHQTMVLQTWIAELDCRLPALRPTGAGARSSRRERSEVRSVSAA